MLSAREKFVALVANDCIQKSDAIILLEGDGTNRLKHCADLFHQGWAEKICFSGGAENLAYGSYPFPYYESLLKENSLSELDFILELKSKHTKAQAIEIFNLVEQHNWKKIILVASHYHQYRAFLTFIQESLTRKLNLLIYNSPALLPWFKPESWGVRYELIDQEFLKIEEYIRIGHCANYEEALKYFKWRDQQV